MNHRGAEGLWSWLGVIVGPDRGPRRAGVQAGGVCSSGITQGRDGSRAHHSCITPCTGSTAAILRPLISLYPPIQNTLLGSQVTHPQQAPSHPAQPSISS